MRREYGHEDLLVIEAGAIIRGTMRQVWWGQRRELFIQPDGQRKFWVTAVVE